MKKRKKESLILGAILQNIAPRIGARALMEPRWEIVGQITFKSGRRQGLRKLLHERHGLPHHPGE